jgi:hypothetical protein
MHEFSVMTQIVDLVLDEARKRNASKVEQVDLEVGEFTMLGLEQMRSSPKTRSYKDRSWRFTQSRGRSSARPAATKETSRSQKTRRTGLYLSSSARNANLPPRSSMVENAS